MTYEEYTKRFKIIFKKMIDAFGEEAVKEWANWSPPVKHKKDWAVYRHSPALLKEAEKAEKTRMKSERLNSNKPQTIQRTPSLLIGFFFEITVFLASLSKAISSDTVHQTARHRHPLPHAAAL